MGKRLFFILFVIVFSLLLSIPDVRAAVVKVGIRELTRKAEDIVVGKVLSKKCSWNENRTQINTYITLQVKKNLTEELINDIITVKHLGGQMGKTGFFVSDAPSFREQEEVLLFLSNSEEPGTKEVVGDAQGKFSIYKIREGKVIIWEGRGILLSRFEGMIKRILIGQRMR